MVTEKVPAVFLELLRVFLEVLAKDDDFQQSRRRVLVSKEVPEVRVGHFRVSTGWQNVLWSLMGWWSFCGFGCDESGQNVVEEDRRSGGQEVATEGFPGFLSGGLMASEEVLSFQSLVWSSRSLRMEVLGSREVLRSDH